MRQNNKIPLVLKVVILFSYLTISDIVFQIHLENYIQELRSGVGKLRSRAKYGPLSHNLQPTSFF